MRGRYSSLVLQDQATKTQREFKEKSGLNKTWNYDFKPLYVVSFLNFKDMFDLEMCLNQVLGTEIEDLFIRSELAKMTVEQRLKYEEDIMTENDIRNSIAEQLEDAREAAKIIGEAEGRVEGGAEGRIEGRIEAIRKMADSGLTAEQICSIMDMPLEDIERILERILA